MNYELSAHVRDKMTRRGIPLAVVESVPAAPAQRPPTTPPRAHRGLLIQQGIQPPGFTRSACSRARCRVARGIGRPF